VTLRTERIRTLDQLRAFLEGNEPADFELTDRTSAYAFVRRTLVRFEYHGLGRPDKTRVKRFLEKVTGFSRAQVTRLIRQHRRNRPHPRPSQETPRQALSSPLPAPWRRVAGRGGEASSATSPGPRGHGQPSPVPVSDSRRSARSTQPGLPWSPSSSLLHPHPRHRRRQKP